MLNTTYTVGTAPYALVYTKQFDTETASHFTVRGLAASAARNFSVSQQEAKNKSTRTLYDTRAVNLIPGTTSGQTYEDRVYTVVVRSPYTSEADILGQVATHNALLASSGFLPSTLAGEK